MNKAQLIEALAERLGDKKTATDAVEGVTDIIVRNVNKGEKVNITGFGVFEKRARAARTARNPRTGETVKVKKTNVPAFRAGTQFKEVVGGQRKLPRVGAARKTAGAAKAAAPSRGTTTRAATTRAKATTTRAATTRAKATTTKAATTRGRAATTAKKATTAKPATTRGKAATTAKKATTASKTARPATRKSATTRKSTKK